MRFITVSCLVIFTFLLLQSQSQIPANVINLMKHYKSVVGFENNYLLFKDGSKMIYDDGKAKEYGELLENSDIEDMFQQKYKSFISEKIPVNHNPGRFRNEAFFKKVYGGSSSDVEKNLVTVNWCPKLANQKIRVTKVNNVHLKVEALSKELDKHPEYQKYIADIAGSYTWRVIRGTQRLSTHSFGIAIDINLKYSHYWQWDCKCEDEKNVPPYKNLIPAGLVKIFEKHGFIWGGNWYHYDTMHFEYRPELIP
jgi:hypothetical protein